MTIELDWHEGDENPGVTWESAPEPLPNAPSPPATIARGHRAQGGAPGWVPRFLVSVLAGLVLGAVILAGVLVWRSERGNEQARQDVAIAATLVLDAWKNHDILLYSDLLDSSDPVWKSRMVAGLRSMPPPEAITVDALTLDGPVAVAEVTEMSADGVALQKLAFYRLTNGQWRLSPPQPDSFGPTISEESSHFRITVRERDEHLLPDLVNMAEGGYVTLCGELRCTLDAEPLVLRLAYDFSNAGSDPAFGEISILSPWLTGRTAKGLPAPAFEQELIRQLAVQLALDKAPNTAAPVLEAIGDWAAAELAGAPMPGGEALPLALQNGGLLPLDVVWRQANSPPHVANPLVKAQLHTMLTFAQATLVDDAIGRLLEAGTGPLSVVLQRAFRLDATTFSADWLRWLSADFGSFSQQVG